MALLTEYFPEFTEQLSKIDDVYEEKRIIDKKTDELIRFALSIKARSESCVLKHFKGALDAGAEEKELAYILALVMRESAGADDCWTHGIIADLVKIKSGETAGGSCCG